MTEKKDSPSDNPQGEERAAAPIAAPEDKKPSFRDIAFKKNDKGEFVINIIKEEDFHQGYNACSYPSAGRDDRPYYEFLNPDTLSIHEPDPAIDPWQQLDRLIGLEAVKNQIRAIERRMEFDRMRHESGFHNNKSSNHFAFMGNAGTGKTEVARLLGALLHKAGVLSRGHVIEVDRSNLVMGHIGQSAIKTREVIDAARGGILFIDEAYSLWQDPDWDFGPEVVSALMKGMEDFRDDLVVIFAGYKDQMKVLLDSNPGLRSRIRHHIEFADYSADELGGIYKTFCTGSDYIMDENAQAALRKLMDSTRFLHKAEFGNGRFVRNVFEMTLEKMAGRVIGQQLQGAENLQTIRAADIPALAETGVKNAGQKSISEKIVELRPRDDD